MKKCVGQGMIRPSEFQYQDAGGTFVVSGSKGMKSKIRDSLNWLLPVIKNSYDRSSKIGVADCSSRNHMAADPAWVLICNLLEQQIWKGTSGEVRKFYYAWATPFGLSWEWKKTGKARYLQVARGGIEPPTHGFSVRCSTNWAIWPQVGSYSKTPLIIGDYLEKQVNSSFSGDKPDGVPTPSALKRQSELLHP